MKRFLNHIYLLLAASVLFTSCLDSDDDDFVLYDDVAITSFFISNAKVLSHTTSSAGGDSLYYANSTVVANYPFTIDHVKGEIFNADSLPYGTNPKNLLCDYTAKNNGMVGIENLVGDSVAYLSTTDSIDFSTPRYLRVYSSDNSVSRRYKVTVNIHQELADSFQWKQLAANSELAALSDMKAVVFGGNLHVFGSDGTSTVAYATSLTDGNAWIKSAVQMSGDAYNNVVVAGGKIYVLDGEMLKSSADGTSFADVAAQPELAQLVGGSIFELYALGKNGAMKCSRDGGVTWVDDICDAALSNLPVQDVSYHCAPFGYVEDADYAVMVGNRSLADYPDDKYAMVWRKIVEYSTERQSQWAFIEFDNTMRYPLPRLSGLKVFGYGSSLLAMGGAGIGGCTAAPFANIYESRDGGITWKASKSIVLADAFDASATSFAVVTDADNFIWIVCGGTGQVWRGRLNKMGWEK